MKNKICTLKNCNNIIINDKFHPFQKFCSRRCSQQNYEKTKRKKRSTSVGEYGKYRKKVIIALGEKCVACGDMDYCVLTIDHINNDGNLEKTSLNYFKRILKNIEKSKKKYQILCMNHNYMKEFWKKEFKKRFPNIT